mmetsp:Transcript_5279/g.9677  ORF Transcript_5279/g.9677 Transcript_5279/m.9677 type:complete len:435 (-) Transcript_5279:82-1386(-)|eukprot:CAMPEP_0197526316 /NCGR_PEP_ID=MMETSP1318-20131121/17299_1 /TAXON_ID=552666 /ORGANISM="Partenskyella glossopodia, Strain RCC365" /LENGTH=434 /DNA_ID=CAMNT_0043080421 /DNA_START=210 /DNA_END=1514 /DNA_ORIENTATION=-
MRRSVSSWFGGISSGWRRARQSPRGFENSSSSSSSNNSSSSGTSKIPQLIVMLASLCAASLRLVPLPPPQPSEILRRGRDYSPSSSSSVCSSSSSASVMHCNGWLGRLGVGQIMTNLRVGVSRRMAMKAEAQRRDVSVRCRTLNGGAVSDEEKNGTVATLILIRHGESEWNREEDERFTGWFDVPLSKLGAVEASDAGQTLREAGILDVVHIAFTSKLKRSYDTLDLMIPKDQRIFPTVASWRLNERHYGALQGYNKNAVIGTLYTKEQVRDWRRAWNVPPPPMGNDHPHYDVIRRQYSQVEIEEMGGDIPRGESLEQTATRLRPFWDSHISPYVKKGKTILVVAHANSLRSLIGTVFDIPKAEIEQIRIPTGMPLVYKLDSNTEKPLPAPLECGGLNGEVLWTLESCPVLLDLSSYTAEAAPDPERRSTNSSK